MNLRPDFGVLRGETRRPAHLRTDRRSFQRALAARVFSHIHKQASPDEIVARTWPTDDEAGWLTRASMSPDSTTGSAAALAITKVTSLLLVAPGSAAAQLFDKCLRIDLEGILQVNVPHAVTHPTPIFVAEGGPIPVVQGATGKATVGPARKLCFIVPLTRELDEATPE